MIAETVAGPGRLSPELRGMAVGLAGGLVCVAFAAVLPEDVAYLYLGAQLAGVGWVRAECGRRRGSRRS